jgi:transposase
MAESGSAWEPGVDLHWWENVLVAIHFRPVDRDQEFLLPPNMTDWLRADHVVWFLIEVVEQLDLTAFYARAARRRDGQPSRSAAGRAAFDPRMLLTLLLYGYACGERSSRQIERLCHTDVAFRLICAGDIPDHSVIARFRRHHADAFAALFTQVLLLCREAGLVKLCTVAIDGTKIAANASPLANRGEAWLRAEAAKTTTTTTGGGGCGGDGFAGVVGQILEEAEQTDAAQDALFGDTRGDELPPGWDRHGADRQARIAAGLARIEQVKQATEAQRAARAAEQARRDADDLAAAEQALATELATRLAAQHAWEQRWAAAVDNPATPLPRGRAPKPAEDSATVKRAHARVDTARERVDHPDTAPRRGGRTPDPDRRGRRDRDRAPRANLTDPDSSIMPTIRGWLQAYNTQFAHSADQMILATMVATNPADILSFTPMINATQQAAALLDATNELGTVLFDTGYASDATLSAPGPDRLIALGKSHSVQTRARQHPTSGPPPPELTARQRMDHRLRTPEGAKLYKRRGATVEPGIGNFKKLLDRYSGRGLNAAISETHFAAAVFNLLKLHRAAPT